MFNKKKSIVIFMKSCTDLFSLPCLDVYIRNAPISRDESVARGLGEQRGAQDAAVLPPLAPHDGHHLVG